MFHKCFPSHFVNYSDSNRLTKPLVGRYRAAMMYWWRTYCDRRAY